MTKAALQVPHEEQVPQIDWNTEAPLHPPISADIEPIPAYEASHGVTSDGEPPYKIITREEYEAGLKQDAPAETVQSTSATALLNLLNETAQENGLATTTNEIMKSSSNELSAMPKAQNTTLANGEISFLPTPPAVEAVPAGAAASVLTGILTDAMHQYGDMEFAEILNTPAADLKAQREASGQIAQEVDENLIDADTTTEDVEADDNETPTKSMRFGILRASAWLARGRDAVLKHTVGRAAQAAQVRQEAAQQTSEQQVVAEEQTETSRRNEKLKKVALWAAVGAGAVAVAGVRVYIQNKGTDFIGDHMPIHFGHGPKNGDLGRQIGEMAGQHSGPKAPSGAGNSLQEAINNAHSNFSVNSGDTPWSVLTRNGIGGDQVYNRLTDAAQHLQADKGIPFEWHGTGTNMWIEVGGKSDTQSVMDALTPYL